MLELNSVEIIIKLSDLITGDKLSNSFEWLRIYPLSIKKTAI